MVHDLYIFPSSFFLSFFLSAEKHRSKEILQRQLGNDVQLMNVKFAATSNLKGIKLVIYIQQALFPQSHHIHRVI